MKLIPILLPTLSLLSTVPLASAWGALGHRTVAYLSTMYLRPDPSSQMNPYHFINSLLNGQDISEAALFPDKVVHMPQFHYTAPWHYIDARDNPPVSCGINFTRDCLSNGCVVSAIANHTARATDRRLSHALRGQALRFVLHFLGDIHQPLHTETLERGGNGIPVLFGNRHTNLHSVWDTLMPNKLAGGAVDGINETDAAWAWAQRLYALDADPDASVLRECRNLDDAVGCALGWADEANRWVCEYVLKDAVAGLAGRDLAEEYYDGAVPILDEMVGKAGRRLGAWLNAMARRSVLEDGRLRVQAQEL